MLMRSPHWQSQWHTDACSDAAVVADVAHRAWDAIVIGAGPAGSTAARQLALAGAQVLLVDRQTFPRSKPCGGCLNERTIAMLRSTGLSEVLTWLRPVPLERLALRTAGGRLELDLPGGAAILRSQFDAALVQAAVAAGTVFLPETSAEVKRILVYAGEQQMRLVRLAAHGDHVPPTGAAHVQAKIVIAADGLGHGSLRHFPELACRVQPSARIGLGATLEAAPDWCDAGVIAMALGQCGYVGMVRTADDRLSIAAAVVPTALRAADRPAQLVAAILRESGFPLPAGLEAAAWKGTLPLARRSRRLADTRIFLIGDAAGYGEPFTGEGIGLAMSAALAVVPYAIEGLSKWHPRLASEWQAAHRRTAAQGRFGRRLVGVLLGRPWAARRAVSALAAFPGLARPLVRRLSTAPPEALADCRAAVSKPTH